MARCGDHLRRGDSQRAAGLLPGRQGRKGARLDPQHALRRRTDAARRRNAHDPGRGTGAGRHCAARIRRQNPRRPAPGGGQEPAHRRSGADRRIGSRGKNHRSGAGKIDRRRSRVHGLLGHHGRLRSRQRRRRRHRQRDRTRQDQPATRQCQRPRNAAAAPDQEPRSHDHRRRRRRGRRGVCLWPLGNGHAIRRALPGHRRHCRVADSGRPAGVDHDHPGHRRAAHGAAQCDHPPPARRRNPGFGIAYLFRQDRHADADGNDGGVRRHGRIRIPDQRQRLRPGGRGQEGRPARRQGFASWT